MALEERRNYGLIAGAPVDDIYLYLLGKRDSLEKILKKDTEERKKLPFWLNCGSKVKNVEDVLTEAKAEVDNFLSLDKEEYNPKLYTKSFLFGYLRAIGTSGIILGVGISSADPPNMPFLNNMPQMMQPIGVVTALIGAVWAGKSVGMGLFGSLFHEWGEYVPEIKTIIAVKSRRNLFKHMLLREYARAASAERIRKVPLPYYPFEAGFAEGVAATLMSREDKGEHAIALNNSRKLLKRGIEFLQLKKKEVQKIGEKLYEGKFPREHHKKGLEGMGYCLFRLAEERHGADVYREVYSGNTRALFD